MDYKLLENLAGHMRRVGLKAGEEFPGHPQPQVDAPTAAVGLRELDIPAGMVRYNVRILSPRILGGWCCQVWAARAVEALHDAGMACETEQMEYLSGSDCFCVTVTAAQSVVLGTGGWTPGGSLQVFCGEQELKGVQSFTAVRDQGRRLLGTTGEAKAVGITPGREGWSLELRQRMDGAAEELAEPFTLTVRVGDRVSRYTGCCWNEERYEHTGRGLGLIRRGFALGREEADE